MPAPPSIPDHTLLRPIGRGAYGEVWLARNVMGAARAVKIIWRAQFESERPFERELAGVRRYEPVSRSADGLVHVLHVGQNEAEGCFYYVMELADAAGEAGESVISESVISEPVRAGAPSFTGSLITDSLITAYSPRTLRSDLRQRGRLPPADCLRLALDVVSGLAQLHRQGLLHRDVKPANIIFVGGRAKLADIGLVSADGDSRTFVGTEGYIPPEGPGSPAADLYALGITLYEAGTGLRSERFPELPAGWLDGADREEKLEFCEIMLKACEAQRERRYASAEALQADLALLQSGQSLRRVRALERRVKLARRGGLAAAALAVVATAGVVFSEWRARVAEQAGAREAALRVRAETAERDARERLHGAYLAEARLAVKSDDAGRRFDTLEIMRQAGLIRVTPETRRAAFAALTLPDLRVARTEAMDAAVTSMAFSGDFKRRAVARGAGPVEIRDESGSNVLLTLPPATNAHAHAAQFSPDDRYLAFKRDYRTGADAALEVWDLAATQRVYFAAHGVTFQGFGFHPRLPRLLLTQPGGQLVEWDLARNEPLRRWPAASVRSVSYAPDGGRFAVARGQLIETRDAGSDRVLSTATLPGMVYEVAWPAEGGLIAAACEDGGVHLVDPADGAARLLGRHKAQAVGVGFLAGGRFLISRGWDRELQVWNVRTERREVALPLRAGRLHFDRTGRRVAAFDRGASLALLEFNPGDECRALAGELTGSPRLAHFSPDQRWLAFMSLDALHVWDLARPGPPARADRKEAFPLGFSPDSTELFAWLGERTFRWRVRPGPGAGPPRLEPLPVIEPGLLPPLDALTAPPALWLRGPDSLQTVLVTNTATSQGYKLRGADWSSAVSPDGRWLAWRGAEIAPLTRLVPLTGDGPERRLTNAARVRFQAFSPDSATLAVLTERDLSLIDTRTWTARVRRPADGAAVSHLGYSPDGRLLLCAEDVRTGAVLDARTLETLVPLPDGLHPMEFSPDGRWLLAVRDGRETQLWDWTAVRAHLHALGLDWAD